MIGSERGWLHRYCALLLMLTIIGLSSLSLRVSLPPQDSDVSTETATVFPPVFITPHHLAAREHIETVFQTVSEKVGGDSVRRIILISPNHFEVGSDWVIGSDESWETPSGELPSDVLAVRDLKDRVSFVPGILEREHGIRNLLPFVKRFFPGASLVPLALREGMPHEEVDALARELDRLSDAKTVLIVSVDFSHYLDWNFSRFHDAVALAALTDSGLEHLDSLDVDCVACLRIAKRYAELRGAPYFQPVSRSSALELAGKNLVGEETSHLTGYFTSDTTAASPESAHLLFSGSVTPDMMSGNARRIYMGQHGNIFQRQGRLVINASAAEPFDPWKSERADEVLVGGAAGFSVCTFGGLRIAFVIEAAGGKVFDQVRQAREESDFVIVIGRGERATAHAWIEGGADLVLGTGEIEVQPVEIYRKKLFVPTLGNISRACRRSHCQGIFLGLGISRGGVEVLLMPVRGTEEGVVLATGSAREELLFKSGAGIADEKVRQSLQAGRFVLTLS